MLTTVEKLHVNEGRTDTYTHYTKEGTALRTKMIFQKKNETQSDGRMNKTIVDFGAERNWSGCREQYFLPWVFII